MNFMRFILIPFFSLLLLFSCTREQPALPLPVKVGEGEARLIFKFRFDSTQEPAAGDQVVDMGVRGMLPSWQ